MGTVFLSKTAKIRISAVERVNGKDEPKKCGDCYFVLANPKDSAGETKSILQDVLALYMKELPAMNYAANTGKESMFLERCVTNGKYCTLLLNSKNDKQPGKVVAAITYQIIPADTQYAEVPLAAVSSIFQHKGIGSLLYLELRKRLQSVGIRTLFCWADKESEGFWLKQGFTVIGEVNRKGRARQLPIKADIRRALCFPGGSTLMMSHLLDDSSSESVELQTLCLPMEHPDMDLQNQGLRCLLESHEPSKKDYQIADDSEDENLANNKFSVDGCQDASRLPVTKNLSMADVSGIREGGIEDDTNNFSCSVQGTRKRVWESSCTSLKSKKVKGTHSNDCQLGSYCRISTSDGWTVNSLDRLCLQPSGDYFSVDASPTNSRSNGMYEKSEVYRASKITNEDFGCPDVPPTAKYYRILLMNIADDSKKSRLTKIIEDLGGVVSSDGSVSTHVVTGKVRKTLNFCTALCSGTELKSAVLIAKASPGALLKGLDIWLATHVQPPANTLSAIVKSAGGNVIRTQNEINDISGTIFVACEEDMEEALSAIKLGVRTFSSSWLMNCIMRQELDLDAPQFAESL